MRARLAVGTASLGPSLNRWLTRERCAVWSSGLLVGEVLVFLFIAAFAHGLIGKPTRPMTTDFVSFYAAGTLADAGAPALAYDRAAHQAAEDRARRPGIVHPVFNYPPVFLPLCALLALLPYLPAFVVFEATTFALFLAALRRVLGLRGWGRATWLALLPLLAFPALLENAALGQNAFLTGALFAWGMLLLPARPLLAGVVLGALCYKPHFGLLLPVALAAGQHWRAIAGAALSVAGCIALSLAVFGIAPWLAYAAALPTMPAGYQAGTVPFYVMVSPLAASRMLGLSAACSYAVQAAAALAAAVAVAWVWHRRSAPSLAAATLLAGTLLTAPLLLFYDLVLAAVATAFLVAHARADGWLAHEKPLLGAVVLAALLAPIAGAVAALPLGPLPGIVLLALCLGHAAEARRGIGRRWAA